MSTKNYEELTFTDDFMFCKVLANNLNLCKELLEMILNVKIHEILNVDKQKSIDITANAKSIRLDVYVEDDEYSVYNIEMQTTDQKNLPKRSRYYQGMIDMNLIEKGADYKELKKSFVIFICLNDLFDRGRHIYTFESRCNEDDTLVLGDEAIKVFVNAKGTADDINPEIADFLEYLRTGATKSDGFASRLEEAVQKAREHKEWRNEYMLLIERDNENIEKGKEIGKLDFCFKLVLKEILSIPVAAEQLNMSEEAFSKEYETWKKENVKN